MVKSYNDLFAEADRLRALIREIATSTDPTWGRTLARREAGIEDKPSQVELALHGELGTKENPPALASGG